ncbi:MAG: hypothetical protein R2932_25845 [Caldilineaceae bacterium]
MVIGQAIGHPDRHLDRHLAIFSQSRRHPSAGAAGFFPENNLMALAPITFTTIEQYIGCEVIPCFELGNPLADFDNFAGKFMANGQWAARTSSKRIWFINGDKERAVGILF